MADENNDEFEDNFGDDEIEVAKVVKVVQDIKIEI